VTKELGDYRLDRESRNPNVYEDWLVDNVKKVLGLTQSLNSDKK